MKNKEKPENPQNPTDFISHLTIIPTKQKQQKNKQESSKIDKINLKHLLISLRDFDFNSFYLYLKSLWKDLSLRSDNSNKGLNKLTFISYYHLPGLISHRLFSVFDIDKDGYLSKEEFITGMIILFTKPYEDLLWFIFRIYDNQSKGMLSKEDITSIFQYIPIISSIKRRKNEKLDNILEAESDNDNENDRNSSDNTVEVSNFINISIEKIEKTEKKTEKTETSTGSDDDYQESKENSIEDNEDMRINYNIDYKDRLQSQEELKIKLENLFNSKKNITFLEFKQLSEEKNSDFFVFLLIFLLLNRPFCNKSIEMFNCYLKSPQEDNSINYDTLTRLIVSPNVNSKFSPSEFIRKSPVITLKSLDKSKNGMSLLEKYSGIRKGTGNLTGSMKEDECRFVKTLNSDVDDRSDDKINGNYGNYGNYCNSNIKHEGFMYKLTKEGELKRLWFRLYNKDLFCK